MNNAIKGLINENIDYFIIGGGLGVLPIAKKLAESCKSVLVAEAGTYLCYEIGGYYRPWAADSAGNRAIADRWFPGAYSEEQSGNGEVPLHLDAVKLGAEDRLLEAGVKLLYNVQLLSVERADETWHAVLASKGGLKRIVSKYLIDCTENNITASLLPLELLEHVFTPEPGEDIVYRTVEFTGVAEDAPFEIVLPAEQSQNCGQTVKIHRGFFSSNHFFVEIPIFISSSQERSLENDMRVEMEARKRSLEICGYLVSKVDTFKGAQICLASGTVMRRMPGNPLEYLAQVEEYAEKLTDEMLKDGKCLCIGNKYENGHFYNEKRSPLIEQADVCVAGGGPSGSSAAFAAGREGVSVILLDFNNELGGTGTSGSVRWYWFGMRRGFTKTIDARTDKWQELLGWKKRFYVWGNDDEWSTEAKAMAYLDLCTEMNVRVYLGCIAADVFKDGNMVTGILASTPYGGMRINCKAAIDATGDGDIAAYSGVEYEFGNGRDRMTMWGALSPLKLPATYAGDYSTSVDVTDAEDRTRFILSERRRWGKLCMSSGVESMTITDRVIYKNLSNECTRPVDHSTYLAPRESRHIKGGYKMSLMDQLLQKRYKDTVMVSYSNNDPKGISMADIVNIGLLPPNLRMHVPYRCIIPEGVDGIIIAGRALSCTHDANCAIRMQDDMQMLGGAAGVAAAISVKDGVSFRDIDVRKLQKRLVELDAIDEDVIRETDDTCIYDLGAAIESIKRSDGLKWEEQSQYEYTKEPLPIAIICNADREKAVPLLQKALAEVPKSPARLYISRLLAYHGCEDGLDDILEQIDIDFSGNTLPKREDKSNFAQVPPDHNMMPETAYLLHGLAFCRSKRVIPVFKRLVDILEMEDRDYASNKKGVFYYVRSVAYSAERLGFKEFIPLLQRLLALPEISCSHNANFIDISIINERQAYLGLQLNMALARCGSRDGYFGLVAYLKDICALIRRSAYDELCDLTGRDFEYNMEQWNNYIAAYPQKTAPKPWTRRLE